MKFKEFKSIIESDVVSFDRFRLKAAQKQGRHISDIDPASHRTTDKERIALFEMEVDQEIERAAHGLPLIPGTPVKPMDRLAMMTYYRHDVRELPPQYQDLGKKVNRVVVSQMGYFKEWGNETWRRMKELHNYGKELKFDDIDQKNSPIARLHTAMFDVSQFLKELETK